MADLTNITQADFQNLAIESSFSNLSFPENFVWDWYIRLSAVFPTITGSDMQRSLQDVSKEPEELWQGLKSRFQVEGQLYSETLVDSSKAYFWLIGMPSLSSTELVKCRQFLRDWQKDSSQKMKGTVTIFEAKLIPRKVFLEHGFEIYVSPASEATELKTETPESIIPVKTKKGKIKEAFPAAGSFKKIKGSNPQEVRRQFLEHNMKASGSPPSTANTNSSGKLRPGREVLNRMKFDSKYNTKDYVVGYIDRKAGILEKNIEEWGDFGQEELMAYIKNAKDGEIVWDKARKVDLVFGKKGS